MKSQTNKRASLISLFPLPNRTRNEPLTTPSIAMDSTHGQSPLPLKSSASKLPIKRKALHPSSSSSPPPPNPDFPSFSDHPSSAAADVGPRPLPFKFHRIWTEPDEIRFVQGLLDSASHGLVFPRDLHVFYDRFSDSMPQPYTKSQLSEKLRRLRKKFRVISSRLDRGLDVSMLSPHDRALYDLSKKLWSPDFPSISPFIGNPDKNKVDDDAVGAPSTDPNQNEHRDGLRTNVDGDSDDVDHEVGERREDVYGDGKLGEVAAKTVMEVFDQCLREARMSLLLQGTLSHADSISSKEGDVVDFGKRWEEQQALELDAFARRLRLVLENSLVHQN